MLATSCLENSVQVDKGGLDGKSLVQKDGRLFLNVKCDQCQ
jgi:hypothetical protein